jgi:hypothetical protein
MPRLDRPLRVWRFLGPRRASLGALGTALLCAILPLSGCICESASPAASTPLAPRELAWLDFTGKAQPTLLSLWPADDAAPSRKKHQLLTSQRGTDLVALTEGVDSWFNWHFEKPVRAGALSVELESNKAGELELFWATAECKIFAQECSAIEPLGLGRHKLDFLLDPAQPINGLRLDLPAERGTKLTIHRISLHERPRIVPRHQPRAGHTETRATPDGLRISCESEDPWITLATPWLQTERVDSVEVELGAPPGAKPKLYWHGTACPHFSEDCQVILAPLEGRNAVFGARLLGAPGWRGRAEGLRLDPDDGPGEYVLKSLVLVRSGSRS